MATIKRSKKGRAVAARAKSAAGKPGTTARKTKSPARTVAKTKPRKAAKSGPAKRPVVVRESAEVVALRAKLQRERNALEKRLTEAMKEIGLLRHHELRATQLERQLAERDATIGRLQTQLSELERRPAEPVYVHEVQQSLALGGSARDLETTAPDLDEFEDDRALTDEGDVLVDED